MSRIKCKQCDLANFATEINCKRCGTDLHFRKPSKTERSFDFSGIRKILFFLAIGGVGYFLYPILVEQKNQLKQEIDSKSSFKKELPKPQPGYQKLIKDEIKKIPSSSPQ